MTQQLPNFAKFNIVAGTNGTGKSTLVSKIIQKTHFRDVLAYIENIDTYGNPFNLPAVDFYNYKGGKVTIDADTIALPDLLQQIVDHFRNGMLVLDEAGMYRRQMLDGGRLIQPLVNLMKQRRKYNVETYFIYHSVAEIPIELFHWCNNVILFHQTGEFKHKAAVLPQVEALKAAQERIRREYFKGNRYYWERVKLS
jgi:ABC-type cobalamin/Fe3+-siderophores transport system ATPase subunit